MSSISRVVHVLPLFVLIASMFASLVTTDVASATSIPTDFSQPIVTYDTIGATPVGEDFPPPDGEGSREGTGSEEDLVIDWGDEEANPGRVTVTSIHVFPRPPMFDADECADPSVQFHGVVAAETEGVTYEYSDPNNAGEIVVTATLVGEGYAWANDGAIEGWVVDGQSATATVTAPACEPLVMGPMEFSTITFPLLTVAGATCGPSENPVSILTVSGADGVTWSVSPGTDNGDGSYTLPGGQAITLTFTLEATRTWPVDLPDPGLADGTWGSPGTDSVTYRFTAPDIDCDLSYSLTKTSELSNDADGNGTISFGDSITYTITIENTGTSELTDLTLRDEFEGSGVLTWRQPVGFDGVSVPSIPAGDVAGNPLVLTATYPIQQGDIDRGEIRNCTFLNDDTVKGTNCVTDSISQHHAIEIEKERITQGGGNPNVSEGEDIRYAITVTNTGNTSLSGIVYEDYAPSETHYVIHWSFNQPQLCDTIVVAGLAVGTRCTQTADHNLLPTHSLSFELVVEVANWTSTCEIRNTAQITAVAQISEITNDNPRVSNEIATGINCPGITITKRQLDGGFYIANPKTGYTAVETGVPVTDGDYIAYEITISNTGDLDIGTAWIRDTAPDGTAFVGVVNPNGPDDMYCTGFEGGTSRTQLDCYFNANLQTDPHNPLAVGESRSVIMVVRFSSEFWPDVCQLENTATLMWAAPYSLEPVVHPFTGQVESNTVITPADCPLPHLDIPQVNPEFVGWDFDRPGGFVVGDPVPFIIRVSNGGSITSGFRLLVAMSGEGNLIFGNAMGDWENSPLPVEIAWVDGVGTVAMDIPPGGVITISVTYTLTQADIERGHIEMCVNDKCESVDILAIQAPGQNPDEAVEEAPGATPGRKVGEAGVTGLPETGHGGIASLTSGLWVVAMAASFALGASGAGIRRFTRSKQKL